MNPARLAFCILLAALGWIVGCVPLMHHPDPLEGWHFYDDERLDKTIKDDYQDYIQKLPPETKYYVRGFNIHVFEDGTGRRAVKISIPLNGVWWEHVLIYDKDNKRVKVTKYASGRYAC